MKVEDTSVIRNFNLSKMKARSSILIVTIIKELSSVRKTTTRALLTHSLIYYAYASFR